jgi:flagellar hook-basal body complex protein FliE
VVKEITLKAPCCPSIESAGGAKQSGVNFGKLLNEAIDQLNESQVRADVAVRKFLDGEVQDVHQVVIALREAELTMQLAVEVRNKILEAYRELSRMPL